MPCKVSGYPSPIVTWFKNQQEISYDSRVILARNNSLIIANVTERDEGLYSCRASNIDGKAVVKDSTVIVIGKPITLIYFFLKLN